MADFRKWFLVLAVLAIVALPVSAQITCAVAPSTPIQIRAYGLTELVGDVVFTCSGPKPSTATTDYATADFLINTGYTVSNRLVSSSNATAECPAFNPCITDALLLPTYVQTGAIVPQPVGQSVVNYAKPIVGLLQPNLVLGADPRNRTSILFPNVSLPFGTTTQVRITNVRIVAPAASNTTTQTSIYMQVSTNPYGAFSINTATQVVGYVGIPVLFNAMTCDDKGAAATTFQQCVAPSGGTTFNVKFTEGFKLAFKPRGTTTQNIPGAPYNTESGLVWPASVEAIAGTSIPANTTSYADSGTQLVVKFANIPTGVKIYVSQHQVASGTSGGDGGTIIAANLTKTSGDKITTGCSLLTGTIPTYDFYPVTITNGTGTAAWAISTADQTAAVANKTISFGVVVSYTPNTSAGLPGLTGTTPGAVSGTLGPTSTVDYAVTSDNGAVPRFLDNSTQSSAFTIVPCVTNLLFPFVTNAGGFDTGVALVNTSLDTAVSGSPTPFATPTQTGACTVYYFNGSSTAPAPQTTASIAPGAMATFMLGSGGITGSTSSTVGFQGYIIARCNFQFAHGYAYITDKNIPSTGSAGYLALVIPDRNATKRSPDPFTTAGAGAGEQLTN